MKTKLKGRIPLFFLLPIKMFTASKNCILYTFQNNPLAIDADSNSGTAIREWRTNNIKSLFLSNQNKLKEITCFSWQNFNKSLMSLSTNSFQFTGTGKLVLFK